MTHDLIQKLRTGSTQERRVIAIDLVQERSKRALTELKRMVDGRRRKGFRWYNYDDQLIGIEALGISKTSEALEFLSRVYSSLTRYEYGESFFIGIQLVEFGAAQYNCYKEVEIDTFSFPWAKKELGKRLTYSVELNEHRVEGYSNESPLLQGHLPSRPEKEIEEELREIFSKEPHFTIQKAVKELETTTGKTAQIATLSYTNLPRGFYHSYNKKRFLAKCLQDKQQRLALSDALKTNALKEYETIIQCHSPQAFLRG